MFWNKKQESLLPYLIQNCFICNPYSSSFRETAGTNASFQYSPGLDSKKYVFTHGENFSDR